VNVVQTYESFRHKACFYGRRKQETQGSPFIPQKVHTKDTFISRCILLARLYLLLPAPLHIFCLGYGSLSNALESEVIFVSDVHWSCSVKCVQCPFSGFCSKPSYTSAHHMVSQAGHLCLTGLSLN
jgi:hypothetical protein